MTEPADIAMEAAADIAVEPADMVVEEPAAEVTTHDEVSERLIETMESASVEGTIETGMVSEENVQDSSDPSLAQMISVSESDHNLIYDMLSEQTQRESVAEAILPTAPVSTVAEPVQNIQLPMPLVESAAVSSLVKDLVVQPGPSTTQAELESISVVHEVESTSSEQLVQAEGSSSSTMPSGLLYDSIKALMTDEDPEKTLIATELENFVILLNGVIEKVVNKGLSFGSFKRLLDRRVINIREEGYSDLADSVSADLVLLERELEELQGLRSGGASSYISSRIDSILRAKEVKRSTAEQELRQVQAQSERLEARIISRENAKASLLLSIEQQDAELERLRKAIEDIQEARSLLKIDLTGTEKECSQLKEQKKAFDERSAELEQKIIQLLTLNDSSRALLEKELEQKFEEELASLEERIRCRQLSL